ncbi:MAG TPA: hypothetical protein VGW75_05920, partial [Solirubrobacteraceae bacterium]|nr:hypothetical protein [Solirubrobacteraceae bacterium]
MPEVAAAVAPSGATAVSLAGGVPAGAAAVAGEPGGVPAGGVAVAREPGGVPAGAAAVAREPGGVPAGAAVPAGVAGLGAALPSRVVPNAEVAARLGVEDGWIERRTGIRARRHLGDGESLAALATAAARAALDDAALDAAEVDAVLVATFTADELMPGLAPVVAAALGSRAAAVDVNAACVGFLHAVDLAAAMIGSGRAERVLVIGAEAPSRHLDGRDRRTAGLFG